jgi:hypothetical protein
LNTLTRREFFGFCSRENLKHVFKAVKSFEDGVKEPRRRRSCDEVSKKFFKRRQNKI